MKPLFLFSLLSIQLLLLIKTGHTFLVHQTRNKCGTWHLEAAKFVEKEQDTLAYPLVAVPREQTSTSQTTIPSWLETNNYLSEISNDELEIIAEERLNVLETLLAQIQVSNVTLFPVEDVLLIKDALNAASAGDLRKLVGAIEFLCLLLSVEDRHLEMTSSSSSSKSGTSNSSSGGEGEYNNVDTVMNKESLIAAAFHYCDCVSARQSGLYDYLERSLKLSDAIPFNKNLSGKYTTTSPSTTTSQSLLSPSFDKDLGSQNLVLNDKLFPRSYSNPSVTLNIDLFSEEALKIARGAAQIKKTEFMVDKVSAGADSSINSSVKDENTTSLLISVADDWRALSIRAIACLYRLRGIAKKHDTLVYVNKDKVMSAEDRRVTREGLRIYAPLAQRLGMHRLKNEIEGVAFRLLYPRQYLAAKALYYTSDRTMKSILSHVSIKVQGLLKSDTMLSAQLQSFSVKHRIKEPYSLWKKILKIKYKKKEENEYKDNISIRSVFDAMALRVVFQAKKISESEDNESVRTREKLLCYYIQQLCTNQWPAAAETRFKDYIRNPKGNGYQSLHYTANINYKGIEWPFEIQVRSEEMHHIAEYGVASHWSYKKGGLVPVNCAQPESVSKRNDVLALPSVSFYEDSVTDVEGVVVSPQNTFNREDRARANRVASYLDALTALDTAKTELITSEIFIFVSSSNTSIVDRLISVPVGATIEEILSIYADKYDVEFFDVEEVSLNGQVVDRSSLHILKNGDVVSI